MTKLDHQLLGAMGVRLIEVADLSEGAVFFSARKILLLDAGLTTDRRRTAIDRCLMMAAAA